MQQNYRTNLFDFENKRLILNVCKKHNVKVTSNTKKVALISDDINNLIDAIKESFNNNCKISIHNDIVYVNI